MSRTLPNLALLSFLPLAACAPKVVLPPPVLAPVAIDWSTTKTVSVLMTDFDFTQNHLTFRVGEPVRLLLVNGGSGRHDFSAPEFFTNATYREGSAPLPSGKIVVGEGERAEIDLVPSKPGQYPLECTEFLHSAFGMTGTIIVAGGAAAR